MVDQKRIVELSERIVQEWNCFFPRSLLHVNE
jgi:hypothetical protein